VQHSPLGKLCTISIAWLFHSLINIQPYLKFAEKNKVSPLVIDHLSHIDVSSNTYREFINLVKLNTKILKENTKFLLMTCRCDIYRRGNGMTVFLHIEFHHSAQANWWFEYSKKKSHTFRKEEHEGNFKNLLLCWKTMILKLSVNKT